MVTLPETNSEFTPENGGNSNRNLLFVEVYFQLQAVSFREGTNHPRFNIPFRVFQEFQEGTKAHINIYWKTLISETAVFCCCFQLWYWARVWFLPNAEIHPLVGGWTNPSEKYVRQNGFIFPKFRGENKKIFELPPPSEIHPRFSKWLSWIRLSWKSARACCHWVPSWHAFNAALYSTWQIQMIFLPSNGSWLVDSTLSYSIIYNIIYTVQYTYVFYSQCFHWFDMIIHRYHLILPFCVRNFISLEMHVSIKNRDGVTRLAVPPRRKKWYNSRAWCQRFPTEKMWRRLGWKWVLLYCVFETFETVNSKNI